MQEGFACSTVHEAEEAYRQIKNQSGSSFAVVKAQIHAGGRGKGAIKENGINGVKVGKNIEDIADFAKKYWRHPGHPSDRTCRKSGEQDPGGPGHVL